MWRSFGVFLMATLLALPAAGQDTSTSKQEAEERTRDAELVAQRRARLEHIEPAKCSKIVDFLAAVESDAIRLKVSSDGSPTDFDKAPRFADFHKALGYNFTKGLFSSDNIKPFLIGSLATAAMVPLDDEISDAVRGEVEEIGDTGDLLGGPIVVPAATAALLIATPFTSNQKYRGFTFSLAQAITVNSALTFGLKAAISRTRPNEKDDQSFPSWHASNAFTMATVVSHYYGKKWGIPLYVLASFIAVSRIEKGAHFASDVVFGATLGYIAGRTATRTSKHCAERNRLTWFPILGPRRVGVQIYIQL
jgi:membrane-associated phospholipid phosphatase